MCLCVWGDNDSITWPLCGGNRWRRKGGGGSGRGRVARAARTAARPRGGPAGGRGAAGTVAVLGLDVAEESRCSLALTLLTSSVTGSAS